MKQLFSILLFMLFLAFQSCDAVLSTPESRANEVCDCIRNNMKEKKFGSLLRQCSELKEQYAKELKGDALDKYTEAFNECSADMLEDGLNSLFK